MKKTIPIVGMHCASCARLIERKLQKVPGVVNASVNYGNETAYLEGKDFTDRQVKNVVESLGYKIGVNVEEEKKNATQKLKIKVIVSSMLSVLIMLLPLFHFANIKFLLLLLATPIQFWAGKDFYLATWSGIKNRSTSMDTLVVIGTTVAYLYSVYTTIFGGQIYFETSTIVITLILLGRFLEAKAKTHTGEAIKKLIGMQPKTATVLRDNLEVETSVSELLVNDLVRVRPGEKIATDGKVVKGKSFIDESMITGESIPSEKTEGDNVVGGTINKNGSFVFRVTKVGADTMLSQIVTMVSEAQGSRADIQKLADTFSSFFIPIVLLIAVITFFAFGLVNAIAVLVIACPCAMGLATPTAIMVGVGRGAKKGILIRNAQSLEILNRVKTILFDKTGTLTVGKPVLQNSVEKKYLQIAASLEIHSEHPIAAAILESAKKRNLKFIEITNFKSLSGEGVMGTINGKKYFLGKTKHGNITLVQKDQLLASFIVSDSLKPNVNNVVNNLVKSGIDVWMVTGDNTENAKIVAKQAGIKNVLAGVLPKNKADKVKEFKSAAFVGDGINDAPALATADVGIAMGTGTDVAIESAGIILLNNDIRSVLTAFNLSRATIKVIKENLFWAFGYNVILIPVAALGLLNPMFAAGAMATSSVSVVLNSLRLKNIKL